jgi:E3 ubiquitin-protein ligase BRE1
MEDRKRPAISSADEIAPPSKRVAVNGSKAKDDPLDMKEESWVEVSHTTSSITSAWVFDRPFLFFTLLLMQVSSFRLHAILIGMVLDGNAHQASDDASLLRATAVVGSQVYYECI